MNVAKNIVLKFTQKWQLLLWLEVCFYTIGAAVMTCFLSLNLFYTSLVFLLVGFVCVLLIKPWQISPEKASKFIDEQIDEVEYSSSLFLAEENKLSLVAKLQQNKIQQRFESSIKSINPPTKIKRSVITSSLLLLIGFLGYSLNFKEYFTNKSFKETSKEVVSFQSLDSVSKAYSPPKITKQSLRVLYPNYTNLGSKKTTDMNVKAVEGSRIIWSLKFDKKVKKVSLNSTRNTYELKLKNGVYQGSTTLKNSGFYSFQFIDSLDQKYTSDLYGIDVLQDESPKINIKGLESFNSFNFDEDKRLNFSSNITDDFGLKEAHIIATVSKGSGESVKFREEKLAFNSSVSRGQKNANLSAQINLDKLKMEPGDELYFYVEASDLKQPKNNISRSDTYFAVIKDTVSDQFAVEATMGVNRMPDYFRSQRQLIIDTKKLIKNKKNLTAYQFKFKSNELGFDQKTLRLKYSAFMGEETENVDIVDEESLEVLENEQHDDHDEHDDEKDPLAAYTHDHDGDNEHNLVDDKKKKDSKNPLKEYTHNHSDPESATLFEESLKSKLRKALQQMWDSELQLRLYKPEASLPYQYKALKYLQEIKNSARIYVHRIGFDPPPIKEDKRLSGELEDIKGFSKQDDISTEDNYQFMKQASGRLEQLVRQKTQLTKIDRLLFEKAGNELAIMAIQQPGKYLKTLQNLKQLTTFGEKPIDLFKTTQKGLMSAIPKANYNPKKENGFTDKLNELLLKELKVNGK